MPIKDRFIIFIYLSTYVQAIACAMVAVWNQRTNGKSQFSLSPQVPSIELSHLTSAIPWAQDTSFTEFLPPTTLTALKSRSSQ